MKRREPNFSKCEYNRRRVKREACDRYNEEQIALQPIDYSARLTYKRTVRKAVNKDEREYLRKWYRKRVRKANALRHRDLKEATW